MPYLVHVHPASWVDLFLRYFKDLLCIHHNEGKCGRDGDRQSVHREILESLLLYYIV